MDVLTSETCWALNNEIIKKVTSSWSLFIQIVTSLIACFDVLRHYIFTQTIELRFSYFKNQHSLFPFTLLIGWFLNWDEAFLFVLFLPETLYGLEGSGIESRLVQDFSHPSKPVLGPSSLLYKEYRFCIPEVNRPGRGVDDTSPSSAAVKERVELYLYTPSGPSWPVLG